MSLRSVCCSMLTIAALLSVQFTPAQATDAQNAATITGYSKASAAAEIALEKKFQDGIVAGNIRENMRRLSARPHHVGSPYDKDNAEWILAQNEGMGIRRAHRDVQRAVSRRRKSASSSCWSRRSSAQNCKSLRCRLIRRRNQTAEQLPTYNAYSADGDVTAPLVYVNYGIREDYEQLDRLGISVKGRHRDRALRRGLARHQAESCGGARRDRLHHLFGSARRRIFSGR